MGGYVILCNVNIPKAEHYLKLKEKEEQKGKDKKEYPLKMNIALPPTQSNGLGK